MIDYDIKEEDRDIKIVQDPGSVPKKPTDHSEETAALFHLHQECGNIDRVRQLGQKLGAEICKRWLDPVGSAAKIILVQFCVSHFLEQGLQDQLLLPFATDCLEESIEEYTGVVLLSDAVDAMYSVYLLAVRERYNVPEHIAAAYQQFCGEEETDLQWVTEMYRECEYITQTFLDATDLVPVTEEWVK